MIELKSHHHTTDPHTLSLSSISYSQSPHDNQFTNKLPIFYVLMGIKIWPTGGTKIKHSYKATSTLNQIHQSLSLEQNCCKTKEIGNCLHQPRVETFLYQQENMLQHPVKGPMGRISNLLCYLKKRRKKNKNKKRKKQKVEVRLVEYVRIVVVGIEYTAKVAVKRKSEEEWIIAKTKQFNDCQLPRPSFQTPNSSSTFQNTLQNTL